MSGLILCSVPVLSFGVAQVVTTGIASAATTGCTGTAPGQTVTFQSSSIPGLSAQGTAQVSKTAKIPTSAGTISCVTGSKPPKNGTVAALTIKSKSKLTCANAASMGDTDPPVPCTPSTDFIVDSSFGFATTSGSLFKEVPSESWTVGATHYTAVFTGSKAATCPGGESGFELDGHLTVPASQSGKTATVVACLNGDTGPNTTNNFTADITAELGGNNTVVIQTATLDPANTTISFA